jgi:DNA-binding transcriptional LysR family regulator
MNFRQLHSFVQICRLGSLSRASDSLHTAQPALSRQIRLLEEELGVLLFHRHSKGMTLTAKGERLFERASQILGDLEEMRADIASDAETVTGNVVLGLPPTISELLSSRVANAFMEQCPAVSLRIVPAFSGHLEEWLERGAVDVGIVHAPVAPARLRLEPLFEEDLFLIGPPGAATAYQDGVDFGDIAALPLVLPQPMHGFRRIIEARAKADGVTLRTRIEADSLQMLREFVCRGLGWTILPIAALQSELAQDLLTAAPIRPRLTVLRNIALPVDRVTSAAADHLVRVVRAQTEALALERQDSCLRLQPLSTASFVGDPA